MKDKFKEEVKNIIKNLENEGLNLTDSNMFEYCRCYTGGKLC